MKKIQSALISVFYKDGLADLVKRLHSHNVTIYSTGGTQSFIEELGVPCTPVESLTNYPAILGGRVKTLHPVVFGGILGVRDDATHAAEMLEYNIPPIDLVIVDLYPFEETVQSFGEHALENEPKIIEKIDIGGPSMLRAAAKNFAHVLVIASKKDYAECHQMLQDQDGQTSLDQRRSFAIKAFDVCTHYDNAISSYFNEIPIHSIFNKEKASLRYGENPQQAASFYGDLTSIFTQLHGKALSYNNLVDVDAALQLMQDVSPDLFKASDATEAIFAIIKHTNVCGIAMRPTLANAWQAALAGDPESAFGGVLICNKPVDSVTANSINELFFEVLIAPYFDDAALQLLQQKKNRILLTVHSFPAVAIQSRSLLGGTLVQQNDNGNYSSWTNAAERQTTTTEDEDLKFANIICKHLKSNAIVLVKNKQMLGKGCGQTSRVDALRHAIEKAKQFGADLNGAVLASDAFFPFDDCVKIAHEAGITAFVQPGGSIRDADSIAYCKANNLAMVITGLRHFKH